MSISTTVLHTIALPIVVALFFWMVDCEAVLEQSILSVYFIGTFPIANESFSTETNQDTPK